jgi:sugar phosphate isomerase/epimerase
MKPSISEVTTLPNSFAEDVAHYADAGCTGMEVWLTKLETHLENHSVAETEQLLSDRGITLAAAAYQGGLLLSQGEARKVHFDHFRKRLNICQALHIPTLLIIADFAEPPDALALERSVASLSQAAQWAGGSGVTLGLEFRGKSSFCASLDTALSLIEQAGEPNVGVNLDVFQFYTGPSKLEDLELLTPARLVHVQLCDVAGVPRELAQDSDRILPGDGDFRLGPIIDQLRGIGYTGWVSLELMNPTLWQAKPAQVAEIGLTALRKTLGLAEPRD